MTTLITPTDFSATSLNAVNYAADMAVALDCNLLVLHATESDILNSSAEDHYTDDVELKFMQLKTELTKRTGDKIKILFQQVTGIIENELMKVCERRHPLAVVMATHGENPKTQFFIESITVHLSRHLTYPVIIVPENIQYRQVQQIVLATDLKNIDKFPAEKISVMVKAFNARLHILHVNDNRLYDQNSPEVTALKTKLIHFDPEFHFLKYKNIQEGIFTFAENNNMDIIITLPKKHTFFHKSASKRVIFNSPVTVMAIQ